LARGERATLIQVDVFDLTGALRHLIDAMQRPVLLLLYTLAYLPPSLLLFISVAPYGKRN